MGKKNRNSHSKQSNNSNSNASAQRTEEDIRNDEKEVSHFRDVFFELNIQYRFNIHFQIMLLICQWSIIVDNMLMKSFLPNIRNIYLKKYGMRSKNNSKTAFQPMHVFQRMDFDYLFRIEMQLRQRTITQIYLEFLHINENIYLLLIK